MDCWPDSVVVVVVIAVVVVVVFVFQAPISLETKKKTAAIAVLHFFQVSMEHELGWNIRMELFLAT